MIVTDMEAYGNGCDAESRMTAFGRRRTKMLISNIQNVSFLTETLSCTLR